MFTQSGGQSLVEQKRLQWAREREEMVGLSGLWGALDKPNREKPNVERVEPRRNSLLPPIQRKSEEFKDKAEESETSGYISDSPQNESDSSAETRSSVWSAKRENYWGEQKMQKNLRNECRLRGTPDSLLSTPEDRMKWGDRGVGVGHLWEPVIEMPDSRLPQVFEAYRATPRWVERGLKLSDGNKAEILVIEHDSDEKTQKGNYLLGQNVPVPPDILEERERKRKKALEHQNAIMKQLEEREKKRKEEKENRLREERLEEERIQKERELERLRQDEEMRKLREKENVEKKKEEAMKEALEAAERKAKEDKRKLKKRDISVEIMKINQDVNLQHTRREIVKNCLPPTPRSEPQTADNVAMETCKEMRDSSCQAEEKLSRSITDSAVQSESVSGVQFLNVGNVAEGGLALVLDGGPSGGLLVPQDAVQLLLMSPGQHSLPALPLQRHERVLTPSKLRSSRFLADAATQTDGKCCSFSLNSVRRGQCARLSGRTSGRSDSSEKSTSLERLHSHIHCLSSAYKQRSRSQPRLLIGDRPKWGINRPSVQYLKQSEKDPHYLRRLKRRSRRTKEGGRTVEKLLESDFRLLSFQTDEEIDKKNDVEEERILRNGFRMVSNPSSPRFVPISNGRNVCENDDFEVMVIEDNGVDDFDIESKEDVEYHNKRPPTDEENPDGIEGQSNADVASPPDCPSPESQDGEGGSSSGVESMEIMENTIENSRLSYSASDTARTESPAPSKSEETSNESKPDDRLDSFELATPNEEEKEEMAELVQVQEDMEILSIENEIIVTDEVPDVTAEEYSKAEIINDLEEDEDDEDNNSVVSASLLATRNSRANLDALAQIAALKLGLEKLQHDMDSGCSSPGE